MQIAMIRKARKKNNRRSLKPIRRIHEILENAMKYRTYLQDEKSNLYGGKVAANISKCPRKMHVQLTGMDFDGTDQNDILNFVQSFQMAGITNRVHESAEKWVLKFFFKNEERARLRSNSLPLHVRPEADVYVTTMRRPSRRTLKPCSSY